MYLKCQNNQGGEMIEAQGSFTIIDVPESIGGEGKNVIVPEVGQTLASISSSTSDPNSSDSLKCGGKLKIESNFFT